EVTKSLAPLLELAPTDFPDVRKLFDRLQKSEEVGVGLVYLLCHGFVDPRAGDVMLGSLTDEARRAYCGKYDCQVLRPFIRYKAIVFVTACRAAVAVGGRGAIGGEQRLGLAQLFLIKGAKGVIGPLDSVELLRAAQTAQAFLEKVLRRTEPPDEVPVAEALR